FCYSLWLGRLRGRRQQAVEPKIDGDLAVVIRPVAGGECHHRRAGSGATTEEWKLLAELGVVERGKRLIAELEGLAEPSDQHVLTVRDLDLAARRRRHARDRSAKVVVASREMDDDITEAHLRRCRL